MKSMSTKASLGQRSWTRMTGLTELLLCIMYAAAEHLESLRPREKTA
jgi:hypothetical protein